MSDDDEQQRYRSSALQLVTNSAVLPMVLNAAIQLKLFEIIADAGPGAQLPPSEIASRLQTDRPDAPDMLDRIMCLLASNAILTCSADDRSHDPDDKFVRKERLYGLTPVGQCFVPSPDGSSLVPYLSLLQDKAFVDSCYKLKDAILERAVPFEKAHGMQAFEYMGKHPEFNQVFNTSMNNFTKILGKKMVDTYKGFEHLENGRLVDVGGGLGIAIGIITSRYPTIKGINFDLPHVIQHAPTYPGVKHVGGDMFEHVPEGDAIFMKGVLHDWSDEHCLKLLDNCYKVLPETGKIIVVEILHPEIPDTGSATKFITGMSVLMMTQHSGGKERTKEEFLHLADKAGFSRVEFVQSIGVYWWVMEFIK